MIIKSFLDTDLYKLTMQQAVIQRFPDAVVRYELIIRIQREFPDGFVTELLKEIRSMATLWLDEDEKKFLTRNCYFFTKPYIDFLAGFCYDPAEVDAVQDGTAIRLTIEGYWYRTILWEVPLMALISELFFKMTGQDALPGDACSKRIIAKAVALEKMGAHFADFGTRRRYSFQLQDMAVAECKANAPSVFNGTSNPFLAMKYKCKPIGTQAHEWYMAIAAMNGYIQANKIGLEEWVDVYKGDLGIALPDTFTTDVFLRDFNTKYARLFDGVRQDSGNPLEFADKIIEHYNKLRINPLTKTIVFSDSLNVDTIAKIEQYCKNRVQTSYGIGTNLTNDVGVKPLNMVIKLTAIQIGNEWFPTVKLSDDAGKHTGDVETVGLCKRILRCK
jgi:nicotinate phosphoribosyltransferase